LSVHLLEEMSSPALDALPRERTVIVLTVSPLEEHGPHLPVGVDAFTARHFSEALAEQLVRSRPGWNVVLAPTLHLGSFTFDTVGTIRVRQRLVRDVVVDYGDSLARAGFRYILVANGHGGPGHLVALEEAAAIVSRRRGVTMASLSGHLAWEFLRGRYLGKIEAALGRTLSAEERRAFAEDAHGGWWETSFMLLLKPHLVGEAYRRLPPARYSRSQRLLPNYPLRNGGEGYVGHPALADPAFARAGAQVVLQEAMELATGLIDGRLRPVQRRSPFFAVPFFRTNFWPTVGGALVGLAVVAAWWLSRCGPPLQRNPEHPKHKGG
jgi:creatinine amidohydrolase